MRVKTGGRSDMRWRGWIRRWSGKEERLARSKEKVDKEEEEK